MVLERAGFMCKGFVIGESGFPAVGNVGLGTLGSVVERFFGGGVFGAGGGGTMVGGAFVVVANLVPSQSVNIQA